MDEDEWIHGFEMYLKGSEKDKASLCFFVYDLNGDGFINKEEMYLLLKDSLGEYKDSEDDVKVGVNTHKWF